MGEARHNASRATRPLRCRRGQPCYEPFVKLPEVLDTARKTGSQALDTTRRTAAEALDEAGHWVGKLVDNEADETSD